MSFKLGDKVNWHNGNSPFPEKNYGVGPFEVKSTRRIPMCNCGSQNREDILAHPDDCALHTRENNYQLLTIETLLGDQEIGQDWFCKAG